MRRTIYAALAEMNAAESTALLIAELARYMGNAPLPNRDSVLARIFEALANVKDLDIGPLLALVDDFASPSYRRSVWHVAAMHPSDTSVDFLLAELRLSVTEACRCGAIAWQKRDQGFAEYAGRARIARIPGPGS